MDTRDILKATQSTQRLVQDEGYYKYIFKKTEKIVSVVFYVSNNIETDTRTAGILEDIMKAARELHNVSLHSLEVRAHRAEDAIRNCAQALITLDSKLRVAATVDLLSSEVLHVLVSEIDGVLRGLNKYLVGTTAFDDLDYRVAESTTPSKSQLIAKPANQKTNPLAHREASQPENQADRRERIKVVLSAKGEATIKDISDIISDVSSKTIQRELNTMIEDNIVKRQGERRWSKYSLQ